MKVLHVSMAKGWRGGEQQIAYLADFLKNQGIEQSFAALQNEPLYLSLKNAGVSTIPLYPSLLKITHNIQRLRKAAKDADLIHLHDSKAHTVAVLAALTGMSIPLVLSRRVDFVPSNNFFSRFKYNHHSVKKVICVSQAIEKIMKKSIKKPEIVTTVHSGIDTNKFNNFHENYLRKTYNIPSEHTIIGNTSAIAPHKDYFTFVDTAELLILNNHKIKFFIIGQGAEEESIRNYIQKKGLQEHIIMTGFLENIHDVLPSLDIFFMPSETEGLGTSILDAMAAGVPVVATSTGGITELITNNENGLLAPPANPAKLADQIEKLILSRSLKESIIKNARQKVQHFSKEQMGKKTLKVYKDVLA